MSYSNFHEFELELVQVLFRHGDRTPHKLEIYPNDPDKSFEFPPFGHAQLTNKGKRRAFKLGETLKNRYGNFVGQYKPDNVYAYCTLRDRCKTSLQLVLAGLFPPTSELAWNENLPWIPIPFECNSYDREMFYNYYRDPRQPEFLSQAYQSPEIKSRSEKYNKTFEFCIEKTGCEPKFEKMSSIYYAIQLKREFGLPLPDWCDEKLLEDLKNAHKICFDAYSYNDESKKLFIGPFLEKLIENIKNNINKKSNVKIYLYSAHDLTVYTFLRAHNVNHISDIDYSGTVVLEKLRGKDDKQYVRLLYWPGGGDQFEILKLDGCDEICPLEKYLEIVHPLLPNETE